MPPKKIAWGHVPNNEFVKKKDEYEGKWIECSVCCATIKVRASYGFTEWEHHCSSLNHCQNVEYNQDTGNQNKLTKYFETTNKNTKDGSTNFFQSPSKKKNWQLHVLVFITVKIQNYYNCTTNIRKMTH